MQVLQAANTGITALQQLVDSAKSIANQVLQAPVGYSPKSNFSSAAITGATATNLLGPGSNNTVTGTAIAGATATTTKLSASDDGHHHLGQPHDRRQDDLVHQLRRQHRHRERRHRST